MEMDFINYDGPTGDPFSEPTSTGPFQKILPESVYSVITHAKEEESMFERISALIDKQDSEATPTLFHRPRVPEPMGTFP
ncbi:BgtAc-30061 [Blumeria graminis f. sp. tritici]|uniref:BgtAc-30061 n=2 Tax=Blumeria graminis f. sp. tritici TaxID=62690 RepID=A0A9X9PSJ9_BLUGR|nr:hypothetical protein BGT96224_Ac30061 [Blumeria graminis f. sp. tritici 96224]VCU41240.1 BgtAc-30061 [Blumeria graminis f. sp. tritici]